MLSASLIDPDDRVDHVKFIENKRPNMALVASLLTECETANHWANFGPLYHRLTAEYSEHMQLSPGVALVPCANAGLGLELAARCLAIACDVQKLRWVGPSLSFRNLGRGYFAEMQFLDCDAHGLLDIQALKKMPDKAYDGIVVINPFGMCADFEPFIEFAKATGKKLLIDNAAGLDRSIPDWPWQVFSLHQTKPYGVGEGGLVLLPEDAEAMLFELMNYADAPDDPAQWLNNAKISDIACAFQIARLRDVDIWAPLYRQQRQRIVGLFADFGIQPLLSAMRAPLTTSVPMLLDRTLNARKLEMPRLVPVSRQYAPILPRPVADDLFSRLINYPTHPDMAALSDDQISADIEQLIACSDNG